MLELDFNQFKDIDLLIGGSPCTFWSIGQRDKREIDKDGIGWKLFSKYIEALKTVKPKYFLYENVDSMPKTIRDFISEEFGFEPILIDSQLVSGQRRKRLYWTNIPNVTQPQDKGIKFKDIIDSGFVHTEKSYCLTANYNGAYPADLFKSVRSQVFEIAPEGEGYQVKDEIITINGYKRSDKNTVRVKGLADGWYYIRKMNVNECCRLQNVHESYMDGIKPTAAIKALGNGWTVDVIAHILSFIK